MKRTILRLSAVVVGLVGLALILIAVFQNSVIVEFLEQHVSPDRTIEQRTAAMIQIAVIAVGAFLTGLGILGWTAFAQLRRLVDWLCAKEGWFKSGDARVRLCWFLVATALGVGIFALYVGHPLLAPGGGLRFLYREDGPLEYMTVLFALISSVFLIVCAVGAQQRMRETSRWNLFVGRLLVVGLALACILFAMEEISWGQRIFGWETPEFMQESNYQGETNLHNLTHLLPQLLNWGLTAYCALAMVSWLGTLRQRLPWLRLLFPHPCFAALVLLGALTTGELQEELVVVLLLLHAIQALLYKRTPVTTLAPGS